MTLALETQGLEKQFGGLKVTRDLSLRVEQGARHALIGPNGAGKTTAINLLTGVLRPDSGRILLHGNDITGLPVHTRVLRGLSRTFQINQLYADLTPLETIGLAVSERLGRGGDWWRQMGTREDVNAEIAENLARFHLLDVMNDLTATLPYGKQRLLEIAVAIAAKPRVLLLDEPAAGVPESERHDILAAVAALPREVTVLLIEHDMDLVFSFADRISVLVAGALLVEGPPDEVARDPPGSRRSILARRPMSELLCIEGLRAGYGEAVVLPDMSLRLAESQVLALLGRNGTGKTTLINSIVGITRRFGGSISLGGRDISAMRPDQRARAGIGWVPQERNIFRSLTVEENMTAVAQPGPWTVARVYEMFPRLKERRNNFGNQLSGGEQQMLAIGRALTLNPQVLLLDEPTEGLAPIIVEELLRALGIITRAGGICSIIVEQNAQKILGLADRAVILERGAIVHDAASAALKADPAVLERFLGVSGGCGDT